MFYHVAFSKVAKVVFHCSLSSHRETGMFNKRSEKLKTPCWLGIICFQSVAGSAILSDEASGKYWNSSQIFGLTVSIHILTLQGLRLLWIVSDLFFINSQPFQTPLPHGIHSLLNALLLPISSLLRCLVMLMHVLIQWLDCHLKVYWDFAFILMRY